VQQHVFDDGVGALAVLHDLVEIVAQSVRQFGNLAAYPLIERRALEDLSQLIDQLGGDTREIVDEIQRVLDFVSDPGSLLAQ